MNKDKKSSLDGYLVWTVIIVALEIGLLWTITSQVSYMVSVMGETSVLYYFMPIGLSLIVVFLAVTIGLAGARARERWGEERCNTILNIDSRIFYKVETFIILCVVLGTMIGMGMWTMVTVLNAMIDNNWQLITFFMPYLLVDFGYFQVILPLWVHAALGSIIGGIGAIGAINVCRSVADDEFCEFKN